MKHELLKIIIGVEHNEKKFIVLSGFNLCDIFCDNIRLLASPIVCAPIIYACPVADSYARSAASRLRRSSLETVSLNWDELLPPVLADVSDLVFFRGVVYRGDEVFDLAGIARRCSLVPESRRLQIHRFRLNPPAQPRGRPILGNSLKPPMPSHY